MFCTNKRARCKLKEAMLTADKKNNTTVKIVIISMSSGTHWPHIIVFVMHYYRDMVTYWRGIYGITYVGNIQSLLWANGEST